MKVLLLEDEYLLSRSIRTYLLAKNYFVDDFDNGRDALVAIEHESYDFYILDINTPEMGGLEILEHLSKAQNDKPKIIISAYHDIEYISEAFALGCSDYLKKPFNLQELQIRIEHLSAKQAPQQNETGLVELSKHYSFDTQSQMLYYNGEIEKFSKREHALVVLFVSNLGKVLSDETIRSVIWEGEETEPSTVRSLVNRLRKKLKEELIENIRGFGYMMQAQQKCNTTM